MQSAPVRLLVLRPLVEGQATTGIEFPERRDSGRSQLIVAGYCRDGARPFLHRLLRQARGAHQHRGRRLRRGHALEHKAVAVRGKHEGDVERGGVAERLLDPVRCSAIPTQALPQPSRTIVLQGGRSRLKRAAHVQGICSNLSDRRRCSQRRSRQCLVHPPPTPCPVSYTHLTLPTIYSV